MLTSWSEGADGADDDDLVPEEAGRELAAQRVGERDRLERLGGAAVVDPGVVPPNGFDRLLPVARSAATTASSSASRSRSGTRRIDAAGVGREVAVAGARADRLQDRVAAEDVRLARSCRLRSWRERRCPRRWIASISCCRPPRGPEVRLGELDVVGDHLRPVRVQPRRSAWRAVGRESASASAGR